jgi:hypothetical protein
MAPAVPVRAELEQENGEMTQGFVKLDGMARNRVHPAEDHGPGLVGGGAEDFRIEDIPDPDQAAGQGHRHPDPIAEPQEPLVRRLRPIAARSLVKPPVWRDGNGGIIVGGAWLKKRSRRPVPARRKPFGHRCTPFHPLVFRRTIMAGMTVRKIDATTFEVTVRAGATTVHTVTVDPDYAARLTGGAVATERLVEQSFEFLLEREPNTSILRRFELPVIGRYFPEYERTIRSLLE